MTAAEPAAQAGRSGLWLLYLAWFYPCWWLAQALVAAGPELLGSALGAGGPPRLSASEYGVAARSADGVWTAACAAAGWIACFLAARLAAGARPVAVLFTGWIAYALLGRGLFAIEREAPLTGVALAALGYAALAFALRRLPLPGPPAGRLTRMLALVGVFLGPLAVFHLAPALLRADFRLLGLPQAFGIVAMAILAAAWRSLPAPRPARSSVAAGVLAGIVAALAVFFGVRELGRALAGRAEAARQASLAPVPKPAPLPPASPGFYYKGVNFTSEWPETYGSKSAARVLAELPSYGVNAVALVPYASQRPGDPELDFPLRMERDELVEATAKMAHAEGLRVLLKPQVWVRGKNLYPGDLRFDDPADRARWFASYARFVEHYAELATRIEADMFCVGVEFARLSQYETEWRAIIALARERYRGPLVYAANFGQELDSVLFWDALDYIGVDHYYPLPEDRSVDEIAARIEAVHRRYGKPVLFTEAGFSTYELGRLEPWKDNPGGRLAPAEQARNVEALLRGYDGRPWLHGVFWWKVGSAGAPGPGDGSHLLWGKPAMNVIGKWFKLPAGGVEKSE